MPTSRPHPVYADIALRSQLRQRLLSLPFDGFACVTAKLLAKLGYVGIRSAGRRSFRGRNQHSGGPFAGFDLAASLPEPDIADGSRRYIPRTVIVALKQYPPSTRVWQKLVDGLRGAALRVGASEALLITTSSFSPSVTETQDGGNSPMNSSATALLPSRNASDFLAPVRLVDGEALLSLLIANGIGVTAGCRAGKAKAANRRERHEGIEIEEIASETLTVDDAFFTRVREASQGNGPSDRFRTRRANAASNGWQLTIDLSPRR